MLATNMCSPRKWECFPFYQKFRFEFQKSFSWMVHIWETQQYSNAETLGQFAVRTSFWSRRLKGLFSINEIYTTYHKCTNVLTSDNIQCLSNIPFFYNHIVLTVILGVHTVHYLTHLGCLQVLEKIVFIDGIFDQLLRSSNTTKKKPMNMIRSNMYR